jgi:hypothetical protein
MSQAWRVRNITARHLQGLAILLAGMGCSAGGGSHPSDVGERSDSDDAGTSATSADATVEPTHSTDAATADGGPDATASMCPAVAAPVDGCTDLSRGTISPCGHDANGQPSQTGYLEILAPDGSRGYVCATAWDPSPSGGYTFGQPDQFMSDPQSCCGSPPTPATPPSTSAPSIGFLGLLHGPTHIKPQEMAQPGAGPIRHNPFAVVVQDRAGGEAFSAALAQWQAWSGDGRPHPGTDGTGAYYFSRSLLVNYTIVETSDARLAVVIGPEVSLTADGTTPLGHPTLGACTAGGGAPLVLIAGEIIGTTLTNHSGRFDHDPSDTPEALDHAAALLNCFGIPIASTMYETPKP